MKTITGLMLMLAGFAVAADSADWSKVQALHSGDRVGILRADKKRVEGSFEGASAAQIVIRGAEGQVMVTKEDVVRVYKKPAVRRWTRVLLGVGAGVAAAAVVDGTAGQRFRNEGSRYFGGWQTRATYVGGVVAGGAIGAATGGGDETVYRRP